MFITQKGKVFFDRKSDNKSMEKGESCNRKIDVTYSTDFSF